MSHPETNPHFKRQLRPQYGDGAQPPDSVVIPPPRPRPPRLPREEPPSPPYQPHRTPRVTIEEPRREPRRKPRASPSVPVPPRVPKSTTPPPPPPPPQPQPHPQPSPPDEPGVPWPTSPPQTKPHSHSRLHDPRGQRFQVPTQKKTKAHTWLFAVFCVIFWLAIIIGGLVVLIVYLVFRPQSPHFEVSSATLNAAYLDVGYLLNADVTMLANFTNPNKKVHVDFSSTIIYLYYGSTLIASQYVEPFSASKAESKFANIHMVTSQVQLPMAETQRLIKQMESNGVMLEIKGVFRARSKLGSILRYSYNLYGDCSIMVTRPPGGVLIKRKCRMQRHTL